MTDKQREHLRLLEQLGFSTRHLTYEELVSALIEKYIVLADACEWDDRTRMQKELERIKKPSN